jgi:hypothetical protein
MHPGPKVRGVCLVHVQEGTLFFAWLCSRAGKVVIGTRVGSYRTSQASGYSRGESMFYVLIFIRTREASPRW